jgi:hypothetical protein
MHEDGLAGTTLRVAGAYGSFSSTGGWVGTPSRASEYGFQQDVFASARVARSVQVAVLVPLVATRREASSTTELGGGLGDIAITGAGTSSRLGRASGFPESPPSPA